MLDNLYTFSKRSLHVRFFKWIYGVDPTIEFKTMCPYFWTYVLTIVFLPIVLIIKLFGKAGTQFLNFFREYRKNKEEKAISKLQERLKDVDSLTDQQAFYIYKSRCYNKYQYDLDDYWTIDKKLGNKYKNHSNKLYKESIIRSKQRSQIIEEYKENRIVKVISTILALGLICFILFFFYKLFSYIDFQPIDWIQVWIILKVILGVSLGILVLFVLIQYIIPGLYNYLKCIKMPKCYLCELGIGKYIIKFFKSIGFVFLLIFKSFAMIFNMIYALYKKYCPVITWKE